MEITEKDIEIYLSEIKKLIRKNRYRIEMNPNRSDNIKLFEKYVIDEEVARQILLGLSIRYFSEILRNEHLGYEHELLYVFGKNIELLERLGNNRKIVSLYIKFNKLESYYVIVISIHEQKYKMKYYFR